MIGLLLLFATSAFAAPYMTQGDFDDAGYILPAKTYGGYVPNSPYAAPAYSFYGVMPSQGDGVNPEYLTQFPRQAYVAAFQPQQAYQPQQAPMMAPIAAPIAHPPVACGPPQQQIVAQTAVVQQQPIGIVQNQQTGPTQIYKPGPSPPMVVNPAPVVVRPPPPPPIYVQPQKIFVQPPQVPPVYASNPQVYYAQQNCPNCPQGGQVPMMPAQ